MRGFPLLLFLWFMIPGNLELSPSYTSVRKLLMESRPGGALGYFLGGYVPPGTANWHPVLKKISPKIDTPL